MKRILKYISLFLFALIMALLFLPVLFKDELIVAFENAINKNIDAEINFEDVKVSVFKNFPDVSVRFILPEITGKNEFENISLLKAETIDFGTDLKSLIQAKQGITVKRFAVDKALLNLLVTEENKSNYDILLNNENSESSGYYGKIDDYSISNSKIIFNDLNSHFHLKMDSLNHSGKGVFNGDLLELSTQSNIRSIDITYNDVNYYKNLAVNADLSLDIDLANQKYTIKDNNWFVNNLPLSFQGAIDLNEDHYLFDVSSQTTNKSTSEIISILPGLYMAKLEQFKSEGAGSIDLSLKGKYDGLHGIYPELKMNAAISSGKIKHPLSRSDINNIESKISIYATEGNWNDLMVNINKLDFNVDNNPFRMRLKADQLLGNTNIDGQVLCDLDLSKISNAIQLDDADSLNGKIKADISLMANKEDVIKKAYDKIILKGELVGNNISADIDGEHYEVEKVTSQFNPSKISLELNTLKVNESDFNVKSTIADPLSIMDDTRDARIDISGLSQFINGNDLNRIYRKSNESASDTLNLSGKSLDTEAFSITYNINSMKYEAYDIKDVAVQGSWLNDVMHIEKLHVHINDQEMKMNGELENISEYLLEKDTLIGDLFLSSNTLNTNKLMLESESSGEVERILIPDDIRLNVSTDIQKLIYQNIRLEGFTALLTVENSILSLLNSNADILGGKIAFEGQYNCTNNDQATFDFRYNLNQLPFDGLFQMSSMFKKLAPLAEYLEGGFNSTLVVSGPIGEDMMPIFEKINASGVLEMLKTKVDDLPILEKIENKLGLKTAKEWYIRDSKNWFDIKDGQVMIMPYDFNLENIACKLSGTIGLNKTLDLKLNAAVPKEMMTNNAVGNSINNALSTFEKQAQQAGIDISMGSHIYFNIGITGPIKDARLSILPTGSGGSKIDSGIEDKTKAIIQTTKDSVRNEVSKKTTEVKDSVKRVIESKKDSLIKTAEKKIETTGSKFKDILKEKLDSNLVATADSLKVKDKLDELVKTTGQTNLDSIKNKISNWNPFKKKKE